MSSWYCWGCGIPKDRWDPKTHCRCGESSVSSRPVYGWAEITWTDSTVSAHSLRTDRFTQNSSGFSIGDRGWAWIRVRQLTVYHALPLTRGQTAV